MGYKGKRWKRFWPRRDKELLFVAPDLEIEKNAK